MRHALVPLGQVAEFVRGVSYKPDDLMENFSDGSVVCMRTANIQAQLNADDLRSIPSDLIKSKDKLLRKGDILVSTANSWNLVGKCCWVPRLNYAAAPGGFIAALRADPDKIEPRYLYHWFNSPDTQANARNCGRQTTNISNMDLSRCLALQVPLPELAEQRRIAAILDKSDALRAKRREAIAKLDQLLQSVFLDMFGDPAINPNGYPECTFGDMFEISSSKRVRESQWQREGVPFYRAREIVRLARDGFVENDLFISEELFDELSKVNGAPKPGDLMVSAVGTLGACHLVRPGDRFYFKDASVLRFVPKKGTISEFVQYAFGLDHVLRQVHSGSGSTVGTYTIVRARETRLFSPPAALQKKFARFAGGIAQHKSKLLRDATKLEELFASIQKQAFVGDL